MTLSQIENMISHIFGRTQNNYFHICTDISIAALCGRYILNLLCEEMMSLQSFIKMKFHVGTCSEFFQSLFIHPNAIESITVTRILTSRASRLK